MGDQNVLLATSVFLTPPEQLTPHPHTTIPACQDLEIGTLRAKALTLATNALLHSSTKNMFQQNFNQLVISIEQKSRENRRTPFHFKVR